MLQMQVLVHAFYAKYTDSSRKIIQSNRKRGPCSDFRSNQISSYDLRIKIHSTNGSQTPTNHFRITQRPVYTANRLQRWALTLKAYDFDIEYVKTADFGHADVQNNHNTEDEDTIIDTIKLDASIKQVLHQTIDTLPLTFKMIKHATAKDKLLQSIMINIRERWQKSHEIDHKFSEYYKHRDALLIDGCLM